jgi:hypothetical protein
MGGNGKEKKKEIVDNKTTKLVDILEMAKIKGKLRSLETEREQLKSFFIDKIFFQIKFLDFHLK